MDYVDNRDQGVGGTGFRFWVPYPCITSCQHTEEISQTEEAVGLIDWL